MVKKNKETKKAKGTKKCVIENELMLQDSKNSLFHNKVIRKSQLRFKSDHHDVYTKKIYKIALSSNDDKKVQTFDKITTYPYGASVFKVCENKMEIVYNVEKTLEKNEKPEGDLHVICDKFLKYMKRKCAMEMKRHVKLSTKKKKKNDVRYK